MIIVGIKTRWLNCAGALSEKCYLFRINGDHRKAASEVCKCNWNTPWQGQQVTDGEFHDASTGNTWSIDGHGHTKRDYRKETELMFTERWRRKGAIEES